MPNSISKMPTLSRSWHELRAGFHESLPKSLKRPALVRTKSERPEVQQARSQIVFAKTPSQLSKIKSLKDIPLPGLWKESLRYKGAVQKNDSKLKISFY